MKLRYYGVMLCNLSALLNIGKINATVMKIKISLVNNSKM